MVAQAPRLAPVFTADEFFLSSDRDRLLPTAAVRTVKLLDLLTNRYHVGLLRSTDDAVMTLDLPRAAGFHAGQRIRFIIADSQTLVSRQAMQTALVTEVAARGTGQRLELRSLSELATT